MYTKDKNHRITLRLNDEQFEFVKKSADDLDVSPSDFLRMVVNVSMVGQRSSMALAQQSIDQLPEKFTTELREVLRRENEKDDQHNIV